MFQLRAAAGRTDITPNNAPNVAQKLMARILVLDTEGTSVAIVSLDSTFASDRLFQAKARYSPPYDPKTESIFPTLSPTAIAGWAAAVGDPNPSQPTRLFISASHTHAASKTIGSMDETAPPENDATEAIRKAIEDARRNLRPAKLRFVAKNGSPDSGLGSPGLARLRRPNLEPQPPSTAAYPVDDTLTVLQVRTDDADETLIALVVNYGIHGTLWGTAKRLSPDFLGEAMNRVELTFGNGPVSLFVQGCCGDVGVEYPVPEERRFTDYEVVTAWGGYLANHVVNGAGPGETLRPSMLIPARKTFFPVTRPGYGGGTPPVTVSALRFGQDAVLIGVSGELFTDYRMKIGLWASVQPFFFSHTIVAGLMNGYSGYIPTGIDFTTRRIWDRGGETDGYEMSVTPYTAAIEDELHAAVTDALSQVIA